MTVFGFFPKEDAVRLLPIEPAQATADISVVYVGARGALGEATQLATFEVNAGELVQTVIRDESASALRHHLDCHGDDLCLAHHQLWPRVWPGS